MDTFPTALRPHYVGDRATIFNTNIIKYENGAEQRYANFKLPKKRYILKWGVLNKTELSSLRTFFENQKGQLRAWTITDDRIGTNVRLRFNTDELIVNPINAAFFDVEVEVITC